MNWVTGRFEEFNCRKARSLSALVVYENSAAGWCAEEFFDWLLKQAAPGARCEKNLWMLNLLRTPQLQEHAAVEASRSDVILLSLGRKTELPEEAQAWLGRWMDRRENRAYLIGVLHQFEPEDEGPANNVVNHVRGIAVTAGADFFCWNAETKCDVANTISNAVRCLNPEISSNDVNHKTPDSIQWQPPAP